MSTFLAGELVRREDEAVFVACLKMIRAADNDQDYETRNTLVLEALWLATTLGYQAGWRFDPHEPEWPVAYIELPGAGQVSWHLPQHPVPWDGHTTEEKYRRVGAYASAR